MRTLLGLICALPLLADPKLATSSQGMVSTAHPIATDAGIEILRKGGNAFDAAVAIAATLNVVEPMNSGMGGYGLILIYDASKNRVRVLNASGRIPKGIQPDLFRSPLKDFLANRRGAMAIGPPVNVRAWEELSKGYGKLKWKNLFERAIEAAESGYEIPQAIAQEAWDAFPEHARAYYGSNGGPLAAGSRLIQKDLAGSLELVSAKGAAALHGGPLGEAIAAEIRRRGGFLTAADIADSRPEWWDPISIDYRGHQVLTAPPPANSFSALIRLGIMSRFDVASLKPDSIEYLHRFAEATKHGEWCRIAHAGDPDVHRTPLDSLLAPAYWKQQADRIAPQAAPFSTPGPNKSEGQETTHFVVADKWGSIVTATQTIGQTFGSRVMAPGTGIWLNNSLYYSTFEPKGNAMDVHPGRRKLNSNAPTIVMKDGRPWIAIGAAGGHTIPQTVPQIVMNMIDFRMDMQQALSTPRIAFVSPEGETPAQLAVDGRFGDAVRRELESRGHRVKVEARGIGRLHGLTLEWDKQGRVARFTGGIDQHSAGLARGY